MAAARSLARHGRSGRLGTRGGAGGRSPESTASTALREAGAAEATAEAGMTEVTAECQRIDDDDELLHRGEQRWQEVGRSRAGSGGGAGPPREAGLLRQPRSCSSPTQAPPCGSGGGGDPAHPWQQWQPAAAPAAEHTCVVARSSASYSGGRRSSGESTVTAQPTQRRRAPLLSPFRLPARMNHRRVGPRHVGFSREPKTPLDLAYSGGSAILPGVSRSPLHAFSRETVTRNGSREVSRSPVRVVSKRRIRYFGRHRNWQSVLKKKDKLDYIRSTLLTNRLCHAHGLCGLNCSLQL
jgi:hypothetical protein